jgi:hypothetical protein
VAKNADTAVDQVLWLIEKARFGQQGNRQKQREK